MIPKGTSGIWNILSLQIPPCDKIEPFISHENYPCLVGVPNHFVLSMEMYRIIVRWHDAELFLTTCAIPQLSSKTSFSLTPFQHLTLWNWRQCPKPWLFLDMVCRRCQQCVLIPQRPFHPIPYGFITRVGRWDNMPPPVSFLALTAIDTHCNPLYSVIVLTQCMQCSSTRTQRDFGTLLVPVFIRTPPMLSQSGVSMVRRFCR